MDCNEFEEVIHDLDRPGTQALALREAALNHAEFCNHCAQLMTEAESLDFSLQQIAMRDADLEASPRVEAVLLREYRRHKTDSHRKGASWWFAALSTAAAMLLALGLFLRHESRPNRASGTVSQVASERPATVAPDQVAQRTDADPATEAENEGDYVALPGASDPATLEGGSIVRVVLSRSALLSLGLPVTDTVAGDRIPADLVLSEDGAPQAIRLVSQADAGE